MEPDDGRDDHETPRCWLTRQMAAVIHMSLGSMRRGRLPLRRTALARRMRALEQIMEAVALAPANKWTVAKLAKIANLSPFHLYHAFCQMVGTSIYAYVLHERLAHSLDAVLDGGDDLTAIALDAGFASKSHFTARFKDFFGCAAAERVVELRKTMTARRSQLA